MYRSLSLEAPSLKALSLKAPVVGVVLALALQSFDSALADVFHFKDGRVISGRVAKESQEKVGDGVETVWAVEIEPSTFVRIYASDLASSGHETLKPSEIEYAKRVNAMPETAEAHYELAGWCTANLREFAEAHYLRVLDIDPNHSAARAAVGYKKDENGRWVKADEVMREQRGKIKYKGKWRFPESVALELAKQERILKAADATKDIFRWHNDAIKASRNRQAQAFENLQMINDPLSVSALAELLQGSSKPAVAPTPVPMKLLYIKLLSQFETFDAASALANASVTDNDAQVRNAALNNLRRWGGEIAVPIYLGYLKNESNTFVNRAAEGIGQLGGEECVLPLISALVTKHKQKTGGGNPNIGTSGLSYGGKEKIVLVPVENRSVRGSLTQLTRQNFDFNQDAWLSWYASIHAAPVEDLRRDP